MRLQQVCSVTLLVLAGLLALLAFLLALLAFPNWVTQAKGDGYGQMAVMFLAVILGLASVVLGIIPNAICGAVPKWRHRWNTWSLGLSLAALAFAILALVEVANTPTRPGC